LYSFYVGKNETKHIAVHFETFYASLFGGWEFGVNCYGVIDELYQLMIKLKNIKIVLISIDYMYKT